MTEKQLRDFLTEKLSMQGWICWWSPRVKFRKQQDIFTIWDGVAAKNNEVKFIQFTTKNNRSSHIEKIKKFMELYQLSHTGELWLYDHKKRDFDVEIIKNLGSCGG